MTIEDRRWTEARKLKRHPLATRIVLVLMLLWVCIPAWSRQAPLLAAASSLRTLWPELSAQFEKDTGKIAPLASFASSGLLSTQIHNGAPFEIFLSADLASIERLDLLLAAKPIGIFAIGELSLVAPPDGVLSQDLSLARIASQLSQPIDGRKLRIAIANPVHAPYGLAARDALTTASIWPLPKGQLLVAENAAQTLQFLQTGAVDAALVPQLLLTGHSEQFIHTPLPPENYRVVQHAIALTHNAGDNALAFYEWLLSEASHTLLRQAGLGVPDN